MKKFKFLVLIISYSLLCGGMLHCTKPDDDIHTIIKEPEIEEDISKLEIVWQVPLHPDTLECISYEPVITGENVLFTKDYFTEKEKLIALRRTNGELVWEWSDHKIGNTHSIGAYDGTIVYDSENETFGIDAGTGLTKWKFESAPLSGSTLLSFYGNLWYKELDEPGPKSAFSYLIEGKFSDGSSRLIFKRDSVDGFIPNLTMPAIWLLPDGDTVLLFQNRSLKFSIPAVFKVTLIAYNLSKDSTLYEIEDLTESGKSNVHPPVIWDEKIYFAGAFNMYCLDLYTGGIIWTKELHQMVFSNWFIEEGKLIINPDNRTLYALDPYTGDVIWKHTDSGSTCRHGMKYYNGIIYFTSLGRGRLYAVDINTGEHIWAEDSPNKGGDFYDGVAIDPERGVLYTSDGYFAMCIRLPER